MYRIRPPFWFRAEKGKVYVSSCAALVDISAAREAYAALGEIIAAAERQEAGSSQAALPALEAPLEAVDDGMRERAALAGMSGHKHAPVAGSGCAGCEETFKNWHEFRALDRKRESAGDEE